MMGKQLAITAIIGMDEAPGGVVGGVRAEYTGAREMPVVRLRGGSGGPSGVSWRAWTADTDEEAAARAFERRYGVRPEYVVDGVGGLLLVGPVPEGFDTAQTPTQPAEMRRVR